MASGLFPFNTSFDFSGTQGSYNFQDYGKQADALKGKRDRLYGSQEIGEDRDQNDTLFPDYDFYQENAAKKSEDQGEEQQQLGQANELDYLGEFDFSSVSSTNLPFQEFLRPDNTQEKSQELGKPNKEVPSSFQFSSLELLTNYGNGFKKLKMGKSSGIGEHEYNARAPRKLSAEEIMRVAGARYVQFSDQRYDDFSMVMHPFGHALSGLSDDDTKDVELVHLLLAAAEKVGYEQFERASRLLSRCEWIASERANPVQRIVYYFAEALRERIDIGTGRIVPKELTEADNGLGTNVISVSAHQYLPFLQVMQFTGIQAIIENLASASKIHVIDLEIRSGVQWTGLIQALAERDTRHVDLLKITAIGLIGNQKIEESGKRLESVAVSLKLPFAFNVVYVEDMKDIKDELFKIGSDESLAVYCPLVLRTMIPRPSCLENIMRVMKNLNPAIMVVIEVEANHNSPSFVSRFIEALFYYSAFFECLDTCLEQDVDLRTKLEILLYHGIKNIVATEGHERVVRNVKMEVWSAFFARFKMVELGFSESSLYQANLVIKQFPCAKSCTVDRIGKSVVVGWKGTPIHSVSAWKFARERGRVFGNYRF